MTHQEFRYHFLTKLRYRGEHRLYGTGCWANTKKARILPFEHGMALYDCGTVYVSVNGESEIFVISATEWNDEIKQLLGKQGAGMSANWAYYCCFDESLYRELVSIAE